MSGRRQPESDAAARGGVGGGLRADFLNPAGPHSRGRHQHVADLSRRSVYWVTGLATSGTNRGAAMSWPSVSFRRRCHQPAEPPRVMLMKRIIGLPGETVAFVNGRVLINGQILDEPYEEDGKGCDWNCAPVTLGPDQYYVVGDNRSMPPEYHTHGIYQRSRIVGKAKVMKIALRLVLLAGWSRRASGYGRSFFPAPKKSSANGSCRLPLKRPSTPGKSVPHRRPLGKSRQPLQHQRRDQPQRAGIRAAGIQRAR